MPDRPKIAIDAMGGDHAPDEIVKGALLAAQQGLATIILVGDAVAIDPLLKGVDLASLGIEVVHASEVIEMAADPSTVFRKRRDASISVALRLVKDGRADAAVAAGSTGAALIGAVTILGRVPGIERPAIAAVLPTQTTPVVLLDVGANPDCEPLHLQQFALMGSVYSKTIFRLASPRVGLFSNGTEEGKGNELTRKAHQLLKSTPGINFIGNVEGRDLPLGIADVVVCDGFVGNGLLKLAEGMAIFFTDMLGKEVRRDWRGLVGASVLRPNLRALKRRLDYAQYGGAPLLGVNGVCIIGHGSCKANGIYHTIRVAAECVAGGAIGSLRNELAAMRSELG